MSKRKDGVFSLLRHIIGNQKKIIKEQEKQTKMLQAIESSKEQNTNYYGINKPENRIFCGTGNWEKELSDDVNSTPY